jgi:hypothetical protein
LFDRLFLSFKVRRVYLFHQVAIIKTSTHQTLFHNNILIIEVGKFHSFNFSAF